MAVEAQDYLLGVPFVNRPDLLDQALHSIRELRQRTLVVDNSAAGLGRRRLGARIFRPPVPLSFSQTMNLLQGLAAKDSCPILLLMHNDAVAEHGSAAELLRISREAVASGRRWGVIFTAYDALASFSMDMTREVGLWDTALPQYFADNDYYRRIRLAGFEVIDSGLPVRHDASSTIRSDPDRNFINAVTMPLYEGYYVAKWGGKPDQETFSLPFDGRR